MSKNKHEIKVKFMCPECKIRNMVQVNKGSSKENACQGRCGNYYVLKDISPGFLISRVSGDREIEEYVVDGEIEHNDMFIKVLTELLIFAGGVAVGFFLLP